MQFLRTHIVELPRQHTPVLPNECVACGAHEPDDRIRVSDRAFSWSSLVFVFAHWSGRKERREFPACRGCRLQDRMQSLSRALLFIGLVAAAITLVYPAVKGLEPDIGRQPARLLGMLAALVAISPAYLWAMLFPRAVTLDVKESSTDFQFARADYASRFLERNAVPDDRSRSNAD